MMIGPESRDGNPELPSQLDIRRAVKTARTKLAEPGTVPMAKDTPSAIFYAAYQQYDRVIICDYKGNVTLTHGIGEAAVIFYESSKGRWARSGGSIYEFSRTMDSQLRVDYINRPPITTDIQSEDDMIDHVRGLDEQEAIDEAHGFNVVSAEELRMVTEAITNAYQPRPELPGRKNLSIILRQLGKRVLAAINREQREEQEPPK